MTAQIRLATPGEDETTSGPAQLKDDDQAAQQLSRAFSFPYPQAYGIQLELMQHIFRAIEDGKVGVFESPTGTGKSLSLICSAFTWLRQNEDRATRGEVQRVVDQAGDEPDWVVEHRKEKVRKEMMAQQEELKRRIREARERQAEWKKKSRSRADRAEGLDEEEWERRRKRLKRDDADDSDDDFLASDVEGDDVASGGGRARSFLGGGFARWKCSKQADDEYANLSPEVRALMAQLESGTTKQAKSGRPGDDEEEPETLPRIVYASRTHSQLSQFVAELRKTDFGKRIKITSHWGPGAGSVANNGSNAADTDAELSEPIRTISLGSRKQMCINPEVQKLGQRAGAEAMNERCLELLKGSGGDATSSKKRCSFVPPPDEAGRTQILEFRDHAMAEVTDIEDLVQLGRETKTCPYFAARSSARQAELVTLPYNLLLQKDARQSLNISFKGCVVLIDEAHNLIDNILSTHTVTVTSEQVAQASRQIQTYLDRFALKLKGSNEAHLRQMLGVLKGLQGFCDKWTARQGPVPSAQLNQGRGARQEILSATKLVAEIGGTLDRINLIELERWMKETQIARKVSGYADKQAQRKRKEEIAASLEASRKKPRKGGRGDASGPAVPLAGSISHNEGGPSPIAAMHSLESFILSLANRTEDGRVLLGLQSAKRTSTGAGDDQSERQVMTLKYQLLNPSHVFSTLVEDARAVILAGGTMEPISDFRQQLVPGLAAERFTSHSCGHIIPPSNLSVTVVSSGPRNVPFEFKFENRGDPKLLDELGGTLVNLCNLIPDGLVVFLPSYAFLDTVVERWKKAEGAATASIWKRIEAKKRIFLEPKTTSEVDAVLRDYTLAIDARAPPGSHGGGRAAGGAMLLAVVGAKLSEGINFSDQLARGVVMVGMPFPNAHSPELAERMRYVRELSRKEGGASGSTDAGNELYTNLCMKAVNQSIGRAIRHKDDYASLILLDRRYGRRDILQRLPRWISREAVVAERFGVVAQRNAAFFRAKSAATTTLAAP